MKSCAIKVVAVFVLLCAIQACLAKPKWLWVNDDVMDDLELEADDVHDRLFKNEKRKMSVLKLGCKNCPTPICIKNVCSA